jgi:hypothetical protein
LGDPVIIRIAIARLKIVLERVDVQHLIDAALEVA